jgi:hypothetical protein
LADIIGAGAAALRLARFETLAGLLLLARGEDRLAAEFDAVCLSVGRPLAMRSRTRRRSSFAATPRMAKMISAKSDVVSRNGSPSEADTGPGAGMV